MAARHAQQASIIAQHAGSPLVQVIDTPSSVGSHLHRPIVKLQQQTVIPFIMQQQLHRPPANIVQRFCSMPADTLSSQTQTIFIPPLCFLNVIVHRGTITMFMAGAVVFGALNIPPAADMGMAGIPKPERSIMTADVILAS
jgi:hypothetical protein